MYRSAVAADISALKPNDAKALQKIIEAARLMDEIYLRQVWKNNPLLLNQLKADTTETGKNGFNISASIWVHGRSWTTAALFWTAFRTGSRNRPNIIRAI